MKLSDFDKEPFVLYRVIGLRCINDTKWTDSCEDTECETVEKAIEVAEEMSKLYEEVYIREELEYIYKMS